VVRPVIEGGAKARAESATTGGGELDRAFTALTGQGRPLRHVGEFIASLAETDEGRDFRPASL
jgi:hypothetical protein